MAPDDYMPENWMNFPGSQPVSLDRQNLGMLRQELYKVTWKADGTRYMLLINFGDTYLVDRSFKVRRVQVCSELPRCLNILRDLQQGSYWLSCYICWLLVATPLCLGQGSKDLVPGPYPHRLHGLVWLCRCGFPRSQA